jgi:hypothetical protein
MPGSGWTLVDEQRLHERRLRDADEFFSADLASARYEARLAQIAVTAVSAIVALALLLLDVLVPGHRAWTLVGVAAIGVAGAGVLGVVAAKARRWVDDALATVTAARPAESERYLAGLRALGFPEG